MKCILLYALLFFSFFVQAQIGKIDSLNNELTKTQERYNQGICYGLKDSLFTTCEQLKKPIELIESIKMSIINNNGLIDSSITTNSAQQSLIEYKKNIQTIDPTINLEWISNTILSDEEFMESSHSPMIAIMALLTEKQYRIDKINKSIINQIKK